MSYVMQKDIFYDELKVYENLLTTALLRFGHGHVAFFGDAEGSDETADLIARVAGTPREATSA